MPKHPNFSVNYPPKSDISGSIEIIGCKKFFCVDDYALFFTQNSMVLGNDIFYINRFGVFSFIETFKKFGLISFFFQHRIFFGFFICLCCTARGTKIRFASIIKSKKFVKKQIQSISRSELYSKKLE